MHLVTNELAELRTLWVLSIFPNRPVTDQWEYSTKMEGNFPIKPGQPLGIALTYFSPFPNSLVRARNWLVKNGTASFDRNISTEISALVRRNRNGPFIAVSGVEPAVKYSFV